MKFHKYETLTEKSNAQSGVAFTPDEIFEAALQVAENHPRMDTQTQVARAGLEMLWVVNGCPRVDLSKETMDLIANEPIEDQMFGDLDWPIEGMPFLVCVEQGRPYGVHSMLCAVLEDRVTLHMISQTAEYTGEYTDCEDFYVQAIASQQAEQAKNPKSAIALLEAHKLLQVLATGKVSNT